MEPLSQPAGNKNYHQISALVPRNVGSAQHDFFHCLLSVVISTLTPYLFMSLHTSISARRTVLSSFRSFGSPTLESIYYDRSYDRLVHLFLSVYTFLVPQKLFGKPIVVLTKVPKQIFLYMGYLHVIDCFPLAHYKGSGTICETKYLYAEFNNATENFMRNVNTIVRALYNRQIKSWDNSFIEKCNLR